MPPAANECVSQYRYTGERYAARTPNAARRPAMKPQFFERLRGLVTAAPTAADAYARRVDAQAVAFLYQALAGIVVSITLMPIATVVVMWQRIDHRLLAGWCATAFAVTAARLLLSRAYMRRAPTEQDAVRWGRYYTITALMSGLVWGGAGILFFVPDSTTHQVFLFASIVGLCAGSLILNSYWIASYYAFTLPALLLPGARMIVEGGLAYNGLAVLTLMLALVLIQTAHRTRRSALTAIRLRFENLDLVAQLRSEKERAENASRDKTRFLAAASHDLRQPVHALTLFADALQAEQTRERGKALLGDMAQSIHALNQLLESLIDISKLDADIVRPAPAHFALAPLLERLQAEYLPQAQMQGLDLHMRADDVVLHSDPVLLATVLRNLVSNALRYTAHGGVDVIGSAGDTHARIDVRDTGIGIPAEQHREIFREFYQLNNPERDRTKGLGLGLAIVERLASLLRYRIELQSAPGRGSCFTLFLPLGDRGMAAAAASEAVALERHDVAGLRVLVIDDEVAVRKGMRALLQGWSCEALLADCADDALAVLNGDAPDVIIADYRLRNGKTGVDAIERVRARFGASIPALIVTGDTAPARLREAQASGHALLHKPVLPGKLRAYLRRVHRKNVAEH